MEKLIKKNINNIIIIFLLLQPILDLITGICIHLLDINITIGIIFRFIFLALIMYITVFIYHKKKNLLIYGCIILYSIFYLMGIIFYKDGVGLFLETQSLIKTFYFPLLLISLYSLKEEININNLSLFTVLITYLIYIFIPLTLNIGYKSYEITKVGTLGFFNSANEISGIISIITPIMFIIFKNTKKKIPILLTLIIYLSVITTIGTKTPLLCLIISSIVTIIWFYLKSFKEKKYKSLLLSSLIVIICTISLILIIPKTNFYKNIRTHLDYLKVKNIGEVLQKEELIDHFIFSQRLTFLSKKNKLYENSTPYQKLFGIGYLEKGKQTKLIEMDYFDIFYSHGIIGFLIFFTIYITLLYKVLKAKQKITYQRIMLYTSLFLVIILSLFTGHIITAPAVSIIVIIIILSLIKRSKKYLLFASYNLDIGGIEVALKNLLDNINYNKYDVVVVLEEKKGSLLTKINSHVKIIELKVSNNKNIFLRKCINIYRKIKFSLVNAYNYDFSCCYATYSLSSNFIARISSLNNCLYVHSNYKDVYQNEIKEKEFFTKRKIADFRRIIFVSNESRQDFLRLYKDLENKCLVYNNFIDEQAIKEKSLVPIEISKDLTKTLFVFVGRLDDSSKKLTRAINLIKKIDNCILWIIGDGKDKSLYQNLVKKYSLEDKVIFLGSKKNPYPYMKLADYIILTSDYEGFPVVYLEAITLDKPLLTTIKVSDDQINIENYANIISKEDEKMVFQVKKILQKPKLRKKINLEEIQQKRMYELEKIFDEVI